jgi:hypothetical protein
LNGEGRRAAALLFSKTDKGQMARQSNTAHSESVQLVQKSRSHGGAPGFNFHFNLVLIIGLTIVILLSYLVFS